MKNKAVKINLLSLLIGGSVFPWIPLLLSQISLVKLITDAIEGLAFSFAWGAGVPAVISYMLAIIILLLPTAVVFLGVKRTLMRQSYLDK